jgi:predicted O-methyltransferase YrrM
VTPTNPAVVGWTDRDLHAWQILRPLLAAGGYLPWSEGAMRPSGLVDVCNEIVLAERRRILELGSGTSTVLLARLLRTTGGTLTAIEHDGRWATWVAGQLAAEQLQDVARVVHAPLEPSPRAAGGTPWYAAEPLAQALADGAPDLLIVDGPPAYRSDESLARLPAVPALLDRLASDAAVVLDDIARAGEHEVLERWEHESDLRFERRPDSGIAIGRRSARTVS